MRTCHSHNLLSWNVEGFKRDFSTLLFYIKKYSPSLVFLSEPQIYACNLGEAITGLGGYKVLLNGEDTYDPDLPLNKLRAVGGTMAIWKSDLDPFISPIPTQSDAILPILFKKPGEAPSVHVGIYLPTAGVFGTFP